MVVRVLVTGGFGFIGSNFIRHVLEHRPSWQVTNLDSLTYSGNPENLADCEGHPRLRNIIGDVTDEKLVTRLVGAADLVFHLAAESHVDRSLTHARTFIDTNVTGTQCILEALRKKPSARLVHVSTDEVYGSLPLERPEVSFTEEFALAPNSPYSASKAAADVLVRAYHHSHGINAVITRCSNNFGPFQYPEKLIPRFVTNILMGRNVPLYGDGLNVRDWLHVEDHCTALLAVAERGRAGEIYNVGGGNERSNLELTRLILDILGAGMDRVEWVPDRPGHDRRYGVNTTKLRDELGWEPHPRPWPDVLAETVDWYRRHEQWWRRILTGAYRESQAKLKKAA